MRKQKDKWQKLFDFPFRLQRKKKIQNFPINHKKMSTIGVRENFIYSFAVRYQNCDRGKLENYDLSSLLSNKIFPT